MRVGSSQYVNKDVSLVMLAGVFWGTSFPAIAYALKFISPSQLLFARFILATVIAMMIFPRSIKRILKSRDMIFIGLINGVAYMIQFYGQQWVPAGIASILVNSYIVLAPIFAFIILQEQLTFRKVFAAILGLFGVGLITQLWDTTTTSNYAFYFQGVLLVFLAGVLWGLYITFTKKVQLKLKEQTEDEKSIDADVFVASMFYTAIVGFVVILIEHEQKIQIFNPIPLIAIIYLAIFCSIIPFIIYLKSLDKIPISVSTIALLIEVVVAFYISILYLGETLTWIQGLGSIIVLIAIYLGVTIDTTTIAHD